MQQKVGLHYAQGLRKKVLVAVKLDRELFRQRAQLLNTAITQLQSQLQHLMHLLDVQVKIKQRMQGRFEIRRQWPGRSTEQQGDEKVEGV
jgi:hypothetical protein